MRWACLLVLLVVTAARGQVPSWPAQGPTIVSGFGPSKAAAVLLGAGGATTSTTTTTTTTGASTTTTTVFAADWTAATNMLASWSFDENPIVCPSTTLGPYLSPVNGTANRRMNDASSAGFCMGRDTVNFMQGTASISGDGTHNESATNSTGFATDGLGNPVLTAGLTFGCWARSTYADSSTTASNIFGSVSAAGLGLGGGYGIQEIDQSPRWRTFVSNASAVLYADVVVADGTTRGAFTHVVGVYHNDGGAGSDTIKVYTNAGLINTNTGVAGVRILISPANYVTAMNIENISAGVRVNKGNVDECFVYAGEMTAGDVCRICACGLDGKQCTCNGTAYLTSGRKVSNCGTCDLSTVTCSQANPN